MKIKKIHLISSIAISSLIFSHSLILGAGSSDDENSDVDDDGSDDAGERQRCRHGLV